jgi:serine/threonine-protein kinase
MSPEQARGRPVDRRSDVFSLGIVLFELTTSRRLFRGDSDVETLRLVISGQIPKPTAIDPKYPLELERIVLRALHRDADERYQTAAALENDLRAYLKANRIVVPQSGIAGLLKRVVGQRVEQRRKAVRAALKTLAVVGSRQDSLISNEPVFTPTGRDKITVTGVSVVTGSGLSGVSGMSSVGSSRPSQYAPASNSFAGRPDPNRRIAIVAYVVGLTGFTIALVVLFLSSR